MAISYRFYVYCMCFILVQGIHFGVASSNYSFSDAHRIQLGYKAEHARYVGRLYEVYQYPYRSGETVVPAGSVAYYTDGFCFADAHCIDEKGSFGWLQYLDPDRYFKIGYRVSFEIKNDQHTFFNVLAYKIHEGYVKEGAYCDIALLRLDKTIEEFKGAKDAYDFTQYTSTTYVAGKCVEAGDTLTYIGYGHGGEDADYYVKCDAYRRGCQSKLFNVNNNRLILSMSYQANVWLSFESKGRLEPRAAFENESVLHELMSGGITLLNGKIVGLNDGTTYYLLSYKDYFVAMFLHYTAYFVNKMTFSSAPKLRGSPVFKGVMAVSLMLGPHKKWIDNSCVENWEMNHKWIKNKVWRKNIDDMV